MKKVALLFVVLFFISSLAVSGAEVQEVNENLGPGYTIEKDTIGLRVDSSSRMTQIEDEVIRLENKNGIERFGKIVRVYNADRQDMEVVVARTILPNGISIQTPSTAITDSEFPAFAKSKLYNNMRVKTISFPELQNGCTIAYRIETKYKDSYPGGAFWETSFTSDFGDIKETVFFVEFPKERRIQYITPGHNRLVRPGESLIGNSKIFLWQFKNVKPLEQEVAMPSLQDLSSRVMVSSFASWNEVGAMFSELAKGKMEVSGEMRAKLHRAMGNASGEDKVRRIYSWLSGDKEVVSINLGAPGYDFKNIADVFNEKVISSRDFALLLLALLREAGVDTYPVLVSSYNAGRVYKDFPTVQQFDTILIKCKIGEKEIWIEPENSKGGAGSLSAEMQGRPALVIKENECLFEETPKTNSFENREEVKGEIRLYDDGSIEGLIGSCEFGVHKIQWMKIYDSISENDKGNLAKILLSHLDPRAVLIDYSFREDSMEASPFSFRIHFKINNFASKTGSLWEMGIPLFAGGSLKDLLKINPSERVWPIVVGTPFQEDKKVHFTFPEGFSVRDIPKDIYIENDVGSMQAVCNSRGSDMVYYTRLIIRKGIIPERDAQLLLNILNAMNNVHLQKIRLEEQKR